MILILEMMTQMMMMIMEEVVEEGLYLQMIMMKMKMKMKMMKMKIQLKITFSKFSSCVKLKEEEGEEVHPIIQGEIFFTLHI